MTVCIPIEFKAQGGGFYFLQALADYLETHEHSVSADVTGQYDVLFTSHWLVPRREILKGLRRQPGARIVHRIDGAAADYGRDPEADRRQRAVNRLADLTIFQSEYARQTTRERFRIVEQDGPVIHNAVDVGRFTPDGARREFPEPRRVVSVSWSTNPKKGAALVYETAARNPDIGFYLCGRYLDVPRLPNLHDLGVLDREALAAALRSSDALLTYSQNEACPNHVLEALASGLSVFYADSGAMAEVVGGCGLVVDPETFRDRFDQVMRNRHDWSARARARAVDRFHPERVFGSYVREMTGALERPPRLGRGRRALLAWSSLVMRR